MRNRYRDFDAAIAEVEEQPITFTFRGKLYTLPSKMPAIVPLKAIRLKAQYGSEKAIPEGDLLDLALSVLGKDTVDSLTDAGIDIDKLGEIITWAIAQYQGIELSEEATEDANLGNQPTPTNGD